MGENNGVWSNQVVQHKQQPELSLNCVMSSGGDARGNRHREIIQPKVTQGCLGTLPSLRCGGDRLRQANIRRACECSCLMVIMLLRDTRTVMINGPSILSLPLKRRRNDIIYLDESRL